MLSDAVCGGLPQFPVHHGDFAPCNPQFVPYEGVLITLIVCITIIVVAVIVRSIIVGLHKESKPQEDNPQDEVSKIKLRLVGDLSDKLIAFEEKIHAEGSKNPEQEEIYRKTIKEIINDLK